MSSPNKLSIQFWHQGFGMVKDKKGAWVVPFQLEATARRIAAQAAENTKIPMIIMQLGWINCWGYRPKNAKEMKAT